MRRSCLFLLPLALLGCRASHRHLDLVRDTASAEQGFFTPFAFPVGVVYGTSEFLTARREPPSIARRVRTEPERRHVIQTLVQRLVDHRLPSAEIRHGRCPVYFDEGLAPRDLSELDDALSELTGASSMGDTSQRRCVNWISWWERTGPIAASWPQPEPGPAHRPDTTPPGPDRPRTWKRDPFTRAGLPPSGVAVGVQEP